MRTQHGPFLGSPRQSDLILRLNYFSLNVLTTVRSLDRNSYIITYLLSAYHIWHRKDQV